MKEFERTTEGTNGGVIVLAIRSSQLIGEKKEWYLSSSWRENKMLDEQIGSKQASLNCYSSLSTIEKCQLCPLTKSSLAPSLLVRSFCRSPSRSSLPEFDTLGLSTGALCRMLLYISAVLRL